MELYIKVSGKVNKSTVMEFKLGLMVPDMRVTGNKIKPMVEENFGMLTEMSSKVNGSMIKQMVMEFMFT